MALYTVDSVERVKEAVDMVALVGTRTDLRRVGARHVGLCPFHDERTPSFSVSSDQKLYHCFGCGASGDAIRFVQETEGLDFPGALEALAERYGVELKRESEDPRAEERRRRRERLLVLLERAAAFYARYLWEAEEAAPARAYLEGRGLGERVLREFRVGYAPAAGDRVVAHARAEGFSAEELAATGLGGRGREGPLQDRFRARIMFPLADARGRVLGFGARALREEQRPKYLNTAESELYHKRRQLFGIDRARRAAARGGSMVVVEGYTDVLALHQAGVEESVAIMGTALSQEQLTELSRAAREVLLAFDADRSGAEAMQRAGKAARDRGVELRVVSLPEGKDPADIVTADGVERWRALLDSALSVPEFQVRGVLAAGDLGSAHGRARTLEQLRPLIAAEPPGPVRDEVVRFAADRLDVPSAYLVTQLEREPAAASGEPVQRARRAAGATGGDGARWANGGGERARPSLEALERAERAFLAMCLRLPSAGRKLLERVTDEHLSSGSLRRARDWLSEHFDSPLAGLPDDDPALTALLTDVVMRAEEEPATEPVLELSFLQLELRRLERRLRDAEKEKEFDRQRHLWAERERIRQAIVNVMGETA